MDNYLGLPKIMPEETNTQTIPPADTTLQPAEPAMPASSVTDASTGVLLPDSTPVQPTPADSVLLQPPPATAEPVQPEAQQQTPAVSASSSASQAQTSSATGLTHLFAKLKEKLASRTQKRLDKIMDYARKKGSITNDQVQKLVYVSDATATRYLSKLVKQGKLKAVGKAKRPIYQPVP